MKKLFLAVASALTIEMHALEYEVQLENEQVCVSRVKVFPHEEIGLHRDEHSRIVVALQGGVITRLETDGRKVDVEFPTGVAVFKDADPEGQMHRSVNKSNEPIELIVVALKN